jgi:hypothetical protein
MTLDEALTLRAARALAVLKTTQNIKAREMVVEALERLATKVLGGCDGN